MKKAKPIGMVRDQRAGMVGPSDGQVRRVVEAILNGTTRQCAYRAAGIGTTTFYEWLAKGKDASNEPYASFRAALIDAEAEIEERMCIVITESAPNDPKSAMWWLEKRRPKAFGKRAPLPNVVKTDGGLDDPSKQAEILESIASALSTRTK